ncbi:MAG: tRNA dihydrouridine synthase DusB [Gammaproteobacteria bacterium]|nr:tRNA dihydrouridine synthase DusB [Gammaproteobacteria bacterium]
MKIGCYQLEGQVLLAPMAGVTDLPFRRLCRSLGAAMAVSEMVTSQSSLFNTKKTQARLQHEGEQEPISVQIAGTDPVAMAKAAQFNVNHGAQIIDINMGCPAKKVCNVQAGSALLKDEELVKRILDSVVASVDIPVTLKIRTGWDKDNKNAINIAKIAESSGIQALAIHGRTRTCGYTGQAEYDSIKRVKEIVTIPIIANGDINSMDKAKYVLQYTQADALMIGRHALEKPWVFQEINHFLKTGNKMSSPTQKIIKNWLLNLLEGIYQLYGSVHGARVARKHIKNYLFLHAQIEQENSQAYWKTICQISDANKQFKLLQSW